LTRVVLSADLIFSSALRLVDDEGLEALTMRHLAETIGVATMSLYSHVATKEDVLRGVLNLVTGEFNLPSPDMAPWDALRMINREFRQTATRHPNLVPLIMQAPPAGTEALRTLEAALDALRRAGMDPARTAPAYRLMASFAIGFVSLECGGFFRPVDVAAGDSEAPVDLSAVPRVAEMAPYLAEWDAGEEFEKGMDAIISVLATWVSSPQEAQVVEGDGRSGGDVEGVHAGGHGDADPAVGAGEGAHREPGPLGAHQ
jgi:TetR/AcrR family transcriptional regulator, tetracycline repressor protein